MKTRPIPLWCFLAGLMAPPMAGLAIETKETHVSAQTSEKPDLVTVERQPSRTATNLMGEVEKMIQGGAEAEVIKAFIENWTGPLAVTADDILHLHEMGASTEILTTLIRRSAELHAQAVAAAQTNLARPSLVTTNPPAMGYSSTNPPPAVLYPYPSRYPAYTYSYLYPYDSYRFWPAPYYFSFYYHWPVSRHYGWGYRPWYRHHYPSPAVSWRHSAFHGHYGHWRGHGFSHGPSHGFRSGVSHGFRHGSFHGGGHGSSHGFRGRGR